MGTHCLYVRMTLCVCVGECHVRKVSGIGRQAPLLLHRSLRSTGGRIRIYLAALSEGGGIPSIIGAQG